jgi:putative membrane protein
MYDHHIMGWVIFLSLIIVFIVGFLIIVRSVPVRGWREGQGKSALDLLDERYARGEVSKEEYIKTKKDILGKV